MCYIFVTLCLQGDYESDSRKKLDGLYQEVKKKLEDEQNKRTRDHNSAIAVNEKLCALEKQVNIFFLFVYVYFFIQLYYFYLYYVLNFVKHSSHIIY